MLAFMRYELQIQSWKALCEKKGVPKSKCTVHWLQYYSPYSISLFVHIFCSITLTKRCFYQKVESISLPLKFVLHLWLASAHRIQGNWCLPFLSVGSGDLACFHSLFCILPLLGEQAQASLLEDERPCEAE